jgi:hypothetical protein
MQVWNFPGDTRYLGTDVLFMPLQITGIIIVGFCLFLMHTTSTGKAAQGSL